MANVSPETVLGIFFLTLSGADIDFFGWKLQWRIYIIKQTLPTTRRIELVSKKEFASTTLDPESETFVIHVASLSSTVSPISSPFELNIYPFHRPQVSDLITKEALIKVPTNYLDFADVFSPDLASKLPKYIRINNYAIKLVDGQQLPHGSIYSLKLVELKAYIETNLANRFTRPSKSPTNASILFERKLDGSLCLYVNY